MRIDQVISAPSEPTRIDDASVFPAGVRAMLGLQRAVDVAGPEPLLLELVKIRASHINGCAHCLDMHSTDARALGESDQRRAHIEPYPRRPAPRRARRNARQSRR